jgi:2-oxoglutarate dehydrogenase E2 component (dihydrolipoamide succinyltransferase)
VDRHEAKRPDAVATPAPSSEPPAGREEDVVPLTLLRKRVAARLVESLQTTAQLTTFNEVDMSAVMTLRKQRGEAFKEKYGIKLGIMSFFVKAAIDALKTVPQINAYIRDENLVYRNYFDIGVAVSTDRGLVVPVIRDADRLSFAQVEVTLADLAARARDKKISPDELQGGTFTISNGGVFGSLLSTPILNPPQSGILGLHTIQDRPVVRDGQIVVRPMMYVALTYDHRVIDGRESVTFLSRVKECVEDPTRMLIEV